MALGSANVPGAQALDLVSRVVSLEKTLSGQEKIPGTSAPTGQVSAKVGQIYINVITGEEWKCVSADGSGTVWEKQTSSSVGLTAQQVGAKESGWKPYHFGSSAPSDTTQLWVDTTPNTGGLKYHNGSDWVHVPVSYT